MSRVSVVSEGIVPTTKIRSLPLRETNKLINILNRNNCWKELAGVITHPDHPNELLYSTDNISTLEMQWKSDSSPAEELILHWSTSGRELPNLLDLIRSLKKAGLMRAAMDVQQDLLKDVLLHTDEDPDDEDENILNDLSQNKNDFPEVDLIAEALSDVNLEELTLFSYQDLQAVTNDFSDKNISEGGRKIGEGAYGCVYKAVISDISVAVKRLKDPVDRQFITELSTLTRFKHKNLLPLLGCSFNGPSCCLVYEYLPNGSLQERLACLDGSQPIHWATRLLIAYGSALGINHLHTYGEKPMVHRDIKSANILLDENFVPKVGDFGLVRIGSSSASTTMAVTENVYGTCIYMPREAFYGDVSVKLDSFSFGVVLLELLTGLPPYDTSREDKDLLTHLENCDNVLSMLDPKTDWNSEAAAEIYRISELCLKDSKRVRLAISQILEDLKKCLSYIGEEDSL